MYIKIYKFVIVVIIMANNELEALKNEIEAVREEINTYIEYPEILWVFLYQKLTDGYILHILIIILRYKIVFLMCKLSGGHKL